MIISCGFQCDIGLIHINIHADISATLHLSGPPFGGVVHVDLEIHNFDIYFGDQNNKPAALQWPDFLELVRQTRPNTAAALSSSSSALIVATLVAGAATEKITSSQQQTGGTWSVRAGGVSFRIECKFPIDDMSWGDGSVQQSWKKSATDATETPPIYARPMQLTTPCTSLLTVSIVPPVPSHDKPWVVSPYTKNLPDALWTECMTPLTPSPTAQFQLTHLPLQTTKPKTLCPPATLSARCSTLQTPQGPALTTSSASPSPPQVRRCPSSPCPNLMPQKPCPRASSRTAPTTLQAKIAPCYLQILATKTRGRASRRRQPSRWAISRPHRRRTRGHRWRRNGRMRQ